MEKLTGWLSQGAPQIPIPDNVALWDIQLVEGS
jgi:hypothetical protein